MENKVVYYIRLFGESKVIYCNGCSVKMKKPPGSVSRGPTNGPPNLWHRNQFVSVGRDETRMGWGDVWAKPDNALGDKLGDDGGVFAPILDEECVRRKEFGIGHIDGNGTEILTIGCDEMNGGGSVYVVFGLLDGDVVDVSEHIDCDWHR